MDLALFLTDQQNYELNLWVNFAVDCLLHLVANTYGVLLLATYLSGKYYDYIIFQAYSYYCNFPKIV